MAKVKVYLDSNVVIQAGKPPGGPIMSRVHDLVKADLIEVLTTDLTITEVSKRHTENDLESLRDITKPHFRRLMDEHLDISLPEVTKDELRRKISEQYADSVNKMFEALDAKVLAIDDIKPSIVFGSYGEGRGFFSGDGKKDQFPDAFIFECLKNEASDDSRVVIVSHDADFKAPVAAEKNISLVDSIPDLFKNLGLEVAAPEIEEFVGNNQPLFRSYVESELNNWGLLVADVEDGEIEEITVKSAEPTDLISFGAAEQGGDILIVGKVEIFASVTYSHPNWEEAIYDSEDKRLIPFENVEGVTELTIDADFTMSIAVNENGEPEEIGEFRFRNDKFQWVELHPYDPYEFM